MGEAGHFGARVRERRRALGLTQARLAARAGVSRQLVGAVEAGRHEPRVDAAAAIARALGGSVEALLSEGPRPVTGVLGPPREGEQVRLARVGDRLVCTPAPPAGEAWPPGDAVVRDGRAVPFDEPPPTALVAGCDPAIGLVAHLLERGSGPAVTAVPASSAAARDALADGRCHAAVVHGPDGAGADADEAVHRWRLAGWRVGLAAPVGLAAGWAADVLRGHRPVVQREPGAAVQAALVRAVERIGGTPPDGPRAAGHLEAASWAHRRGEVALTIEPAALALGLDFHPIEEHVAELWVAREHESVAGVRGFLDELTGARLRRRLGAIGGYDLRDLGNEVA